MKSRYWIKLYLEILDDLKMWKLPNHLWRRTIELFLLAGENGDDGALRPVEEISWRLRIPETVLAEDLLGLAEVGVVHEAEPGKWVVTNFQKRQMAEPSTVRSRNHRQRVCNEALQEVQQKGNEDATSSSPLSPLISSESLSDSEGEGVGGGTITPISAVETAIARSTFGDFNQSGQCEKLYQQITGLPTIPSDSMDRVLHDLPIVIDHYGINNWDKMLQDGKIVHAKWCNTRGKNGRNYSPTNPGWIGKWIEELAQRPDDPDPNSIAAISAKIRRDMMEARK